MLQEGFKLALIYMLQKRGNESCEAKKEIIMVLELKA